MNPATAALRAATLAAVSGAALLCAAQAQAPPTLPAEPPSSAPRAEISGGGVTATILMPDEKAGYYRGGRFDWAGIIYSLKYADHEFYGPWFTDRRDGVSDFVFEGDRIVAGPASAAMGPAEEYDVIGYEDARPGDPFIKNVGLQRRPAGEARYNHYTPYELVDRGTWDIKKAKDSIAFTQTLTGPNGYAYVYTKTLRLAGDRPRLTIAHSLKNTGTRALATNVYNHNFLTIDGRPTGPGYTVTTAYEIKPAAGRGGNAPGGRGPASDIIAVSGKTIAYQKAMSGQDRASSSLDGFSASAADSDFRVENAAAGAGVRMRADRPLLRVALWSIRSVVAVEPFIDIRVEPGRSFEWTWTYDYYTTKKQPDR